MDEPVSKLGNLLVFTVKSHLPTEDPGKQTPLCLSIAIPWADDVVLHLRPQIQASISCHLRSNHLIDPFEVLRLVKPVLYHLEWPTTEFLLHFMPCYSSNFFCSKQGDQAWTAGSTGYRGRSHITCHDTTQLQGMGESNVLSQDLHQTHPHWSASRPRCRSSFMGGSALGVQTTG